MKPEQINEVIAALERGKLWTGNGKYFDPVIAIMRGVAAEPELSQEQHITIREASEIEQSDAYFSARAQIDTNDRRKVFEAGFKRGFDAFIYTKEELEAARVRGKALHAALKFDEPLYASPQAAS